VPAAATRMPGVRGSDNDVDDAFDEVRPVSGTPRRIASSRAKRVPAGHHAPARVPGAWSSARTRLGVPPTRCRPRPTAETIPAVAIAEVCTRRGRRVVAEQWTIHGGSPACLGASPVGVTHRRAGPPPDQPRNCPGSLPQPNDVAESVAWPAFLRAAADCADAAPQDLVACRDDRGRDRGSVK
jgi:hypothetical protein